MKIVFKCFTYGIKLRRRPSDNAPTDKIKKLKYMMARMKVRRKFLGPNENPIDRNQSSTKI